MTTEPRPQRETREETTETLTRLRQEHLPRERKMALERTVLEDAHEVRYAERAFRPRHHADIEAVRDAVDALVVERRALPEPAPAPVAAPIPPKPDAETLAALAPVVPGKILSFETRERVAGGRLVEAAYEADGETRKGLYVVREGAARPFDELGSRIDALPPPSPAQAPPTPAARPPPVEADPAPAKEEKKGLASRLKRGKGKPAEPAGEPASAEEKSDAAPKRRFPFGRK